MNILVTGADGFIGKNLVKRLNEIDKFTVTTFVRGDSDENLRDKLYDANAVFHLAAENRPDNEESYITGNVGLTNRLCNFIRELKKPIKFIFSSSKISQILRNSFFLINNSSDDRSLVLFNSIKYYILIVTRGYCL